MGIIGPGSSLVNRTDLPHTCYGMRDRASDEPVTDAIGLEVCLFFKRRATQRCKIFGTRPRRMASSAIARWFHSLIGVRSREGSREMGHGDLFLGPDLIAGQERQGIGA